MSSVRSYENGRKNLAFSISNSNIKKVDSWKQKWYKVEGNKESGYDLFSPTLSSSTLTRLSLSTSPTSVAHRERDGAAREQESVRVREKKKSKRGKKEEVGLRESATREKGDLNPLKE